MDKLTNKQFATYDYTSRYVGVPYYFNTEDNREIYGLGKNLIKTTAWVAHKLTQTDTLDYLALKYYNNPTLWWVIAYFNDIQDPLADLQDRFSVLKIPSISGIQFDELRK